ncbi:NAD(P)-binding protein [Saccharata proteae CBS 121410]|uniref:NAD(P)-binding protein n=1 Tax=Saccharata proteae CBS 121410 TaxID=1314787 RepID=A0A6A5YE99_9PEZI|nr:NAD(P)-binding protein [Saccharata proteae CBS 121410]
MATPSIILGFIYRQLFVTPPEPKEDYTGQTVIVTGANVGLGLETARTITRLGAAKVIITSRSSEKGEAAKEDIEKTTGRTGIVDVWSLDLCSYDSVKAFAARAATLPRLDAVIENAGVAFHHWEWAEDAEITIKTNVISTFLLAFLLLPTLKRSANTHNTLGHLTIVSSEVHFFTSFPERKTSGSIFAHLADKDKARMMDRYNVSKLLEVLTVRHLAQDPALPSNKDNKDYPVVINTVNPGFCYSNLRRNMGQSIFIDLFEKALARTEEVGSRSFVYAAQAGRESHGQYISDSKITPPSKLVQSQEGQVLHDRVWGELKDILESIVPGVTNNV